MQEEPVYFTSSHLTIFNAGPRIRERGSTFTVRAWLMLAALLYMLSQCEQNIGARANPVLHSTFIWGECQNESGNLYQRALELYNVTRTFPTFSADLKQEIPRVSCDHQCDPRSLREDPRICLLQVHKVLHWYHSAFQRKDVFSSFEAPLIDGIKHSLHKLEVSLGAATEQQIEALDMPPVDRWEKNRIAQNLLSFSSLIARIFHPGNPTNHSEQ